MSVFFAVFLYAEESGLPAKKGNQKKIPVKNSPPVRPETSNNPESPEKKGNVNSEKEDWEKDIDALETKKNENGPAEDDDWEKDLEKDLKEQENSRKGFQDSRGTASPIQSQNQMNRSAQNLMMDIAASVDIVGVYDKNRPNTTDNKLNIRTAEFGMKGAVDQWLRGYLLGAAHGEDGKYFFEVHEAWVQLPFLPLNTSLKVGQMFMDVGRLNRIHGHDRPFTWAPIVHEKFIGWESIFDTGAEFSMLFPWKFLTTELVLGSTNGKKWGHAHTEGAKKNNPLFYGHLKNFYYFGNNVGTQFGFSAIRFEPTEDRKNQRYMYGMDWVLRWYQSNLRELMIMSELWYNKEIFPDSFSWNGPVSPENLQYSNPPNQIQWGWYAFAEYKFHQLWSIGYRYDFFTDKSMKNKYNADAENYTEANSLQLAFHSSEYGVIRTTFERRFILDKSHDQDQQKVDQRYWIQAVFILGSHPAHTY